MARLVLYFGLLLVAASSSQASTPLEQRWFRFQNQPRFVLQATPTKYTVDGRPIPSAYDSRFKSSDIQSRSFVDKKTWARRQWGRPIQSRHSSVTRTHRHSIASAVNSGESGIREKVLGFLDRDELRLKGVKPVFRLDEIAARSLSAGKLREQPWSGPYWPTFQGLIASRYASDDFQRQNGDWKSYFDFISRDDLSRVVSRGNEIEIDALSPAEKYDLLIGDPSMLSQMGSGFLTPAMWMQGEQYYRTYNRVESWMGLCHGWAAASFMEAKPRRLISAASGTVENQKLNFYPSDLKGLTTLLWAEAQPDTSFIGGRCSSKEPKTDPETGRILEAECFDVNPGIWHLLTVNHIGVLKRSFVIDATYDYEVWNQPVHSYSYNYFNPQTGKQVRTLKEAQVSRAEFSKDKFAKFRSPHAVSVVGIEMKLSYIVETGADHASLESESQDNTRVTMYMYDIELDHAGNIIGGEWYTNQHPDFLWTPKFNSHPSSVGDSQLPMDQIWNTERTLSPFWRDIARRTAENYGQPVAKIVDSLMIRAR